MSDVTPAWTRIDIGVWITLLRWEFGFHLGSFDYGHAYGLNAAVFRWSWHWTFWTAERAAEG